MVMKILILIFFEMKESKITRGHNFTLVKKEKIGCFHFPRGPSIAPTHDLNAILFPPNSDNTVRCIAVYAISRIQFTIPDVLTSLCMCIVIISNIQQ